MQMKLRLLSITAFTILITFSACKKENDPEKEMDATELKMHSEDQANVSAEMDAVTSEVNVAIESDGSFTGRSQNTQSICGADAVADTMNNPWKISITYNGNNCAGTHHRTGVVVLSMPAGARWKNAGTVLTVTYQNLKIKRLSDNKSLTINGSHTITNVTGGLLINLPTLTNITHDIRSSGMSIKFDDNSVRTWQVARRRVFTYNNRLAITITGTHTEGTHTNVAEWGTTRFGGPFVSSISQPLVIKQDCNFRLVSGQVQHKRMAADVTATFGLNAAGIPAPCPGANPYYYKLEWTGAGGNSNSVILPY